MIEQVANLERLADEYRKASGKDVSEDILLTTLVRVLPKQIQQHIQLGMTDSSTFQEVKDKVLAYERVSTSWSRDRVLLECGATSLGAVTSYASAADSGPGPMEVNMLSKGKGKKGKGDKGKSKGRALETKAKAKEKAPTKARAKDKDRKVNKRDMEVATTLDSHNVPSWMRMFVRTAGKQAIGPRNVERSLLINNNHSKFDKLEQMALIPDRTQPTQPLEVLALELVHKLCVWFSFLHMWKT